MPEQARVTSVDALESFRASLILFVSKARPTLEEVTADVLRTRLWLEDEQRSYWKGQIRHRTKVLEEARETLYRASLSNLRRPTMAEQVAVRRAKQALDEAEDKLRMVRKWAKDFDSRVEPMARHLERLHTVLSNVLPQAIAYLGGAVKTLEKYSDRAGAAVPAAVLPLEGQGGTDATAPSPERADDASPPAPDAGAPAGGRA